MQMMVYIGNELDMDELNKMFSNGWKLVSMVPAAEGGVYAVIEKSRDPFRDR